MVMGQAFKKKESEQKLFGHAKNAYDTICSAMSPSGKAPPTTNEYVAKAEELAVKMYGAKVERLFPEQKRHLIRELTIAYFLSDDEGREKAVDAFSKDKSPYWYSAITDERVKAAIESYRAKSNLPTLSDYNRKTLSDYLAEKKFGDAAAFFEKIIPFDRYVFKEEEKEKWKGFIEELFSKSQVTLPYKVLAQDPLLVCIRQELGPLLKSYDEQTNTMMIAPLQKPEEELMSVSKADRKTLHDMSVEIENLKSSLRSLGVNSVSTDLLIAMIIAEHTGTDETNPIADFCYTIRTKGMGAYDGEFGEGGYGFGQPSDSTYAGLVKNPEIRDLFTVNGKLIPFFGEGDTIAGNWKLNLKVTIIVANDDYRGQYLGKSAIKAVLPSSQAKLYAAALHSMGGNPEKGAPAYVLNNPEHWMDDLPPKNREYLQKVSRIYRSLTGKSITEV